LLEAGLARIDPRAAERRVFDVEVLQQKQEEARRAGVGVWSLGEEVETKESEPEQREEAGEEVLSVRVSEIVDGAHFFIHNTASASLAGLQERMAAFTREHGTEGGPVNARPGVLCAALFDDGTGVRWNRVRIEEVNSAAQQLRVLYVDYGNRAIVPLSSVRSLDASLLSTPPQARECVLAYLRAPRPTDEAST
jgi:staphylococcal nuclease domain-containing protein 1